MHIDVAQTPAVAEVLAFGRSSSAGVAATLIMLASKGRVTFQEREDDRHVLKVNDSVERRGDRLSVCESWLFDALRVWLDRHGGPPAWPEWKVALGREAIATGTLTSDQWTAVDRWSWVPLISKRAVPTEQAQRARGLASQLKLYPVATGELPDSRVAWDTVLSYAVGLRQGRAFLTRVRQVNDYYARHFQGVVMTFYTPTWYTPLRVDTRERFSYLTAGFSRLLTHLAWDRIDLT